MADLVEITIYGASDDLVEIEYDGENGEEFDCPGKWAGRVVGPDGEFLIVTAVFGSSKKRRDADWTLGIENSGDWPKDWTIRFGDRPDYEGDPAIIIEAPVGTKVKKL
ncbi:hypothetical protein SEA_BIG4_256 [Microbacterium phage Big4]|nr:hypothetical protein SEA_BIG4_256 [Microbacterium phage Big4]